MSPIAIVENAKIAVEITTEEFEMIKQKRAKDAHIILRDTYINEINDLIARMEKDGFTLGSKHSTLRLREAKPWKDVDDCWIELR